MQQIERYAVIFLVLLLVTLAVVSFWEEGGQVLDEGPTAARAQRLREDRHSQPGGRLAVLSPPRGLSAAAAQPSTSVPSRSRTAPGDVKGVLTNESASRGTASSPFKSLPPTVATKPQPRELGFPRLLEGDSKLQHERPSRARVAAREEPSAKDRATTNYDTISDRRKRLGASAQPHQSASAHEPRRPSTSLESYTVVAGDTLSGIAYKTLGSSKRWREIQALNGNLDPAMLFVGSELRIPTGSSSQVAPSLPALSAVGRRPQAADGFYIVRKGDMLSGIAQEQLGGASRWREILDLNPAIDPNRLQEGARLRLPDSNIPATRYASKRPSGRTTKQASGKNRVR